MEDDTLNWNDLSMADRAKLIKIYRDNNISELSKMKAHFNSYGQTMFGDGGTIHIKKSHEGAFTEKAKSHGMGVQEFARHVLSNKENYPSSTIKQANFCRNAAKWHDDGGDIDKNDSDNYVKATTYNTNPLYYSGITLNPFLRDLNNSVRDNLVYSTNPVEPVVINGTDDHKDDYYNATKKDRDSFSQRIAERPGYNGLLNRAMMFPLYITNPALAFGADIAGGVVNETINRATEGEKQTWGELMADTFTDGNGSEWWDLTNPGYFPWASKISSSMRVLPRNINKAEVKNIAKEFEFTPTEKLEKIPLMQSYSKPKDLGITTQNFADFINPEHERIIHDYKFMNNEEKQKFMDDVLNNRIWDATDKDELVKSIQDEILEVYKTKNPDYNPNGDFAKKLALKDLSDPKTNIDGIVKYRQESMPENIKSEINDQIIPRLRKTRVEDEFSIGKEKRSLMSESEFQERIDDVSSVPIYLVDKYDWTINDFGKNARTAGHWNGKSIDLIDEPGIHDYATLHEFRHALDDSFGLLPTEKIKLEKAYSWIPNPFGNGYDITVEFPTINSELRQNVLRIKNASNASIKEQNKIIDALTDDEIIEAAKKTGYIREESKDELIKHIPAIKKAMKYVGVGTGVEFLANDEDT